MTNINVGLPRVGALTTTWVAITSFAGGALLAVAGGLAILLVGSGVALAVRLVLEIVTSIIRVL